VRSISVPISTGAPSLATQDGDRADEKFPLLAKETQLSTLQDPTSPISKSSTTKLAYAGNIASPAAGSE